MIDPSSLPPAFKRAMERKPALREQFAKSDVKPERRFDNAQDRCNHPKMDIRGRCVMCGKLLYLMPAPQGQSTAPQEPAVAALTPKPIKLSNEHHAEPAGAPNSKLLQCPAALEGYAQNQTQGARCPVVSFTLFRVSALDIDAKYASCKNLIDGLAYAGLICGDKEGQIELQVFQKKARSKSEECTQISIEY